MRVLLTDIVFPNKYAKWRLVEIHSFIEKYDTDILVIKRMNNYKNIVFNFDYNNLSELFNLKNYNILIFDPRYNYINTYNNDFDGTIYNNKINCSYLIRNKKYGNIDFNINDYDKIYHIFLMNYNNFNNIIKFPKNKQFIHLYPGGGLIDKSSVFDINNTNKNNKTNIISTQHFITSFLNNKNNILELYGGSFFYKNENIREKKYNSNLNLTICFTSMGDIYEKGADVYIDIVNKFYDKYVDTFNYIKFISIGNCPNNKYIKKYQPMDQNQLSQFYYDNVDILINLDSGKALNGFPLGLEAGIEGCLLLTTDIHNSNINNNFNFDDFLIINRNKPEEIIEKIKYLYDNNEILIQKSKLLQKQIFDLFNYDNYMKKIFDFLEKS
jgi:hypothetical protein